MKQPLLIQIKNPCAENWEEMTEVEQGKFCSHCQKTVIDFSMMNDAQVYDYFKANAAFCGRFRNTQLDRIIEKPKPVLKRLFHFYSKAAAIFFTFLSFKNFQASAQTNQSKIENFAQSADEIHPEKITFEGVITDDADLPVDSVEIFFDNIRVTTSDRFGNYLFEIENTSLKNHIISFSKHQYRSSSFSFHPLMGNTKHDITMCNYQGKECYSMGLPARPHFKFNSLHFKLHEKISEMQIELNEFARKLRENPWSEVNMFIYFSKDTDKKLYEKKGQEIINYLVDKQGIDRERLHLKVIKNKSKANTIEIVDAIHE
jgi:hypothetical protein